MAVIKMKIDKASWVQSDMGTITTSLNTILVNNGLSPTTLNWNGTTSFSFEVSKTGMTYAQFQTFRTAIESAIASVAASVKHFDFTDE